MGSEYRRLEGEVVIITGAAQGLGEALAQRLDKEGAKVLVADMNIEAAQKVAAGLSDAIAMQVNVCSPEDCDKMAKAAFDKWGKVDKLVANAGIVISGPIETLTYQQFAKVTDVNLNGYFNTCKAGGALLPQAGQGRDRADQFQVRQEGLQQELRLRGQQVWRRGADPVPGPGAGPGEHPGQFHLPRQPFGFPPCG